MFAYSPSQSSNSTATTSTAATRKRSALTEVTNAAGKNKASTSAASHAKGPSKAGSSTTAPRRYGTRSSTGGSAVQEREEQEEEEEVEEDDDEPAEDDDDDDDDAMVLDDAPVPAPAPRRVVKAMRKSVVGASSKPSGVPIAVAIRPLGAKRTNTSGSTSNAVAGGLKKPSGSLAGTNGRVVIKPRTAATAGAGSVQARRIVKEKAEALRKAEQELEEAELVVQQHKAKKAKTSEGDYFDPDVEDADDDDEEAKDAGWEDLDEGDEDDPLMVSTYVVEVYEYLRELEVRASF